MLTYYCDSVFPIFNRRSVGPKWIRKYLKGLLGTLTTMVIVNKHIPCSWCKNESISFRFDLGTTSTSNRFLDLSLLFIFDNAHCVSDWCYWVICIVYMDNLIRAAVTKLFFFKCKTYSIQMVIFKRKSSKWKQRGLIIEFAECPRLGDMYNSF
jgi:phenylpropionate dioxygenase-like ring-hydroxylating dioxygenase large terminal subunit